MKVLLASVVACAVVLALPAWAEAGGAIWPNGDTIDVNMDSLGYIESPASLNFRVSIQTGDLDATIWVSDSPTIDSYALPAGRALGHCEEYVGVGGDQYTCQMDTVLLEPDATYYWWLSFDRVDPTALFARTWYSGPLSFTLAGIAPVDDSAFSSGATYLSAASLPSVVRYTGARSVKHVRLTNVVFRTMKLAARPRLLAIACWADGDYQAVAESAGIGTVRKDGLETSGFRLGFQPRWLHLAPWICERVQGLIDTKRPNAARARALTTALHEAIHAYGIFNEALTNCFAVQLVPYAAYYLGMRGRARTYLAELATRGTRQRAPLGYWNSLHCRDGGAWDLLPGVANLR